MAWKSMRESLQAKALPKGLSSASLDVPAPAEAGDPVQARPGPGRTLPSSSQRKLGPRAASAVL